MYALVLNEVWESNQAEKIRAKKMHFLSISLSLPVILTSHPVAKAQFFSVGQH